MNENLYIAHKKLPYKTLRVHSARYTQCIHVSSRKLKLPKDTHIKKYKQLLPTQPFPKVELYIAVKCEKYIQSAGILAGSGQSCSTDAGVSVVLLYLLLVTLLGASLLRI